MEWAAKFLLQPAAVKIPGAVAADITKEVRQQIHEAMFGVIRDHMLHFLTNELDLSNGDFFLMLSSLQPHYIQESMEPPSQRPTETVVVAADGGAADNNDAAIADGTNLALKGGALPLPSSQPDGANKPSSVVNTIRAAADKLVATVKNAITQPLKDSTKGVFDDIPIKLTKMFEDDAFLRKAVLGGFRELMHALAKDPVTMDAFRTALGARIHALMQSRPNDPEFESIVVANVALKSTLLDQVGTKIDVFKTLRRSQVDDSSRSTDPASTKSLVDVVNDNGMIAVEAVKRQENKGDTMKDDLLHSYQRIGEFLEEEKKEEEEEKKKKQLRESQPLLPQGGRGSRRRTSTTSMSRRIRRRPRPTRRTHSRRNP